MEDNINALSEKIEKAFEIYRTSELFLKDVSDDYGKIKIARLRLEFARHELLELLKKAREIGLNPMKMEPVRHFFNLDDSPAQNHNM